MTRHFWQNSFVTGRAIILMGLAFLAFWPSGASATIASDACRGNICSGTIAVGSDTIDYSFTQHVNPNGELRVRLSGGTYNTTDMISYIVFDLPPFVSADKFANPVGGAIFLPEESINPGHTAYERRDSDGCVGCVIDQVMTVRFSGLADEPAGYPFNLYFLQNGVTGSEYDLTFYVDAAAPTNDDESQVFNAVPGQDAPCSDNDPPGTENPDIDNDLDYGANCADAQCDGQVGDLVSGIFCEATESTCYDEFDNDGDGATDCRDSDCDERVGRPVAGAVPAAYCQYNNEAGALGSLVGTSPCNDNFDNDADGRTDCFDNLKRDVGGTLLPSITTMAAALLEPLICWRHASYGCSSTENSCVDFIDNDVDAPYSDNEYPEAAVLAGTAPPSVGADCRDYDCAGDDECPSVENQDKDGNWEDAQCFNGADNDLDGETDCADADCQGVDDPVSGFACQEKEFDLGQRMMFCGNFRDIGRTQPIDDDGDGVANCADSDCKQRFGWCGPCPNREDFTFDSCADGRDNDSDGLVDCRDDDDCIGRIGEVASSALCAEYENTTLCSDGFDNDADGDADCADAGCAGVSQCAANETGALCNDGFDNDADDLIDCADDSCAGSGSCHVIDWSAAAACVEVPHWSSWQIFTANDPTVSVRAYQTVHTSAIDRIELRGTGRFESFMVVIGDNTSDTKYYPYAAPAGTCVLSGAGSAQMEFTAVTGPPPKIGHALMINNIVGEIIENFDVTLECLTPVAPAPTQTYPIALSALLEGSLSEYGELNFATRLYESTPPTVVELEPEGESGGEWKVPSGKSRSIRVVPNEPNSPDLFLSSGICRCELSVGGLLYQSPDSSCVVPLPAAYFWSDDPAFPVAARVTDGADNDSAPFVTSLNLNVTPVIFEPLTIKPPNLSSKPFFDDRIANTMRLNTVFRTSLSDDWTVTPTCQVYFRDAAGTTIGPGPSTFDGYTDFSGSYLTCSKFDLPMPSLTDGYYTVSVAAQDSDVDYIETDQRPLYVCNNIPQDNADPNNVCHWADFDGDGASEGYYTDLYSSDSKACDNCVNLANAGQGDRNADGVGDDCSGGDGRCEIDLNFVCQHDSWKYDELLREPSQCDAGTDRCCASDIDPACCPAPSYGDDDELLPPAPRLQACRSPWGLCSFGGEVCFVQNDCPERGACADDDMACNEDKDCEADESIECVGADRCEGLMYPWVQAAYGDIITQMSLKAGETPPMPNATYCLTALGEIQNFESSDCPKTDDDRAQDQRLTVQRPQRSNAYSGSLGRVDIAGLLSGKYGTVVTYANGADFLAQFPPFNGQPLGGKVYVVNGDLTISAGAGARIIPDALGTARGNGTVVVKGDLQFAVDVTYAATLSEPLTQLSRLASIGWIALGTDSGQRGDMYVNGDVAELVGAFMVVGDGGFYSVTPPDTESDTALTIRGLIVARQFHLSRAFRSTDQGSERVIYDGRAMVNPPPGFADAARALPAFTDLPD